MTALLLQSTVMEQWNCQSEPNYRPSCLRFISGGSNPDLIPTVAQVTIPHHPYLDVLPWPILSFQCHYRELDEFPHRLMKRISALMNNGLRCWGPARGSLHGRGEGTPWYSRSWEVMSWFRKKWGASCRRERWKYVEESLLAFVASESH
jgi:hypothetical protein